MITYGPYAPDSPPYTPNICIEARNVLPGMGGYEPIRALVATTSALDGPCLGAAAYLDEAGNAAVFAGTGAKLYRVPGATPGDVSKAGGYTGANWSFANSDGLVVATNYTQPIQAYTLGTSTLFADLSADAPKARVGAFVGEFLMVGNTVDSVDGAKRARVWWSALADPTSWPAPGTTAALAVQSDFQDLKGDGGEVRAIVPGLANADAVILRERVTVRVNYVGSSAGVFSFQPIDGSRGTPFPNSAVEKNGRCYFVSDDGFYETDGVTVRALGQGRVDRWFAGQIAGIVSTALRAAADPIRPLIWWVWPGRYVVYNWITEQFAWGDIDADVVFSSYALSTLVDDITDLVDDINIPVDDPIWSGNRRLTAFFTRDSKLATASGENAECLVVSGDETPFKLRGGRITEVWPLTQAQVVECRVGFRDQMGPPVQYGGWSERTPPGFCATNERGRYFRFATRIAAGETWRFLQGVDLTGVEEGARG